MTKDNIIKSLRINLFYKDTDVFFMMFSLCDLESLEVLRDKLLPEARNKNPKTPYIIIGTMLDRVKDLEDNKREEIQNAVGIFRKMKIFLILKYLVIHWTV